MQDWMDLEELTTDAEQLANMSNALHCAMFESGNTADSYEDARCLLVRMMHKHRDNMKALFEKVHPTQQQTTKGGAA